MTLMFYEVVWQHMHGVVAFLITNLLQIYQLKKIENRLRFDRIVAMSV